MIAESNLPKATEKVVLLSFGEDIIETTNCKTQSKINLNNSLVDISFETLEIHQRRPEKGITFSYVTYKLVRGSLYSFSDVKLVR